MAKHTRARVTTVAAAVALAAVTFTASPASATSARAAGGTVFVQTDSPDGNAVVAFDRMTDGSLRQKAVYRTGGRGGVLDGSVADHTASQGALTYDSRHHLLFAVNPGSDSVTVFAVTGDRLTKLQTIGSGGTFPVSIAVHDNRVFVLNARAGGSLQGFVLLAGHLVPVPLWHRALGFDADAAPEFTHTAAQVAFTPDGGSLVVSTKAAGDSVITFPLNPVFGPSAKPVVNSTGAGSVPFGFVFDGSGRILLTEAGPNAIVTGRVDGRGKLSTGTPVATGEQATCWIAAAGDFAYVANAGSGTVSGYRIGADGTPVSLGTTPAGAGTVDLATTPDGRYLYAQTGADGGVSAFRINHDGSLTSAGHVVLDGAAGGEGIVAL